MALIWTGDERADLTRSAYLRDLELSVVAEEIRKLLEQAWLIHHDGADRIPADVKTSMRKLAMRSVRQTSEMALTLASAAANVELRNRVGFAMRCVVQSEVQDKHAILHRFATEVERGGADDILAAYEQELSR